MHQETKEIKNELSKYIEREFISVRRRSWDSTYMTIRGSRTGTTTVKFNINIIHRTGVEQAFAHRDAIEKMGYGLFFYGNCKNGRVIEPYSVRINTRAYY